MTRDPRSEFAIDDAELGRLVHEVAEDWRMPPVRLDQPGWRERVREGRRQPSGRSAGVVGAWLRRLGSAFAIAVVLTVAVALLGVWLTLPRPTQIGQPGPTETPSTAPTGTDAPTTTPRPTQSTAPTQLPALLVDGDLPSATRLVVQLQEGEFALADLTKGEIGFPFAVGNWGSMVRRAPGGSLYCLCVTLDEAQNGTFTHATVTLNAYDDGGKAGSTTPIGDFRGEPDPRDDRVPENPEHVRVVISFATDPRYAFVGWSARAHPVWHSGLLLVDVVDGAVVDSIDFPDATSGDGDERRMTDAPRVAGQTGNRLIVGRAYYTWSPPASTNPTLRFSTEAFSVPFLTDERAAPELIAAADGCGNFVELAGGLSNGVTWLHCPRDNGTHNVRRIAGDGTALGDTHVSMVGDIGGSITAVSPDGKQLYLWHPVDLKLTRVDLSTGVSDSLTGPRLSAGVDLLGDLGRWLVPSTRAKMLLRAGIAISADGQRVYTLGVDRSNPNRDGGSAGVYAFDVAGAMSVQRWVATADFVSLGVSKDGKFVYAAGLPDVDATGRQTGQPASITVYDAQTGGVRLIAGKLGAQLLTFAQPLLP